MLHRRSTFLLTLIATLIVPVLLVSAHSQDTSGITLTLAGYAVPREAYDDIIPLFQAHWLETTGQQVNILESYQASGAQSRAIAGGFEADIAALSVEPDITRLVDAGLVSADWKTDNPYGGFAAQSVVVLVVRPGNPKNIFDWADLAQPGLEIITPDPATSGGAQWNMLAALGAVRRGQVAGFEGNGADEAYLRALVPNFAVLDRDGRESFLTFERGIGDVAITYENEYYAGKLHGGEYDVIYPRSTILIENPVAVVDIYVDKHGTREVAEAFVSFLWSADAQRVFGNHGFRPVNAAVRTEFNIIGESAAETEAEPGRVEASAEIVFPAIEDLFTVTEFGEGGWSDARAAYFGDEGLFTKVIAEAQGS